MVTNYRDNDDGHHGKERCSAQVDEIFYPRVAEEALLRVIASAAESHCAASCFAPATKNKTRSGF